MAYSKSGAKAKTNEQENGVQLLKDHLKSGSLNRVYLFSGEEKFLLDYYVKELKKLVVGDDEASLNLLTFEGKTSVSALIDACDTFPVFAERKLIIVKQSGLLSAKKKAAQETQEEDVNEAADEVEAPEHDEDTLKGSRDQDALKAYIPQIPDSTCLLFIEDNIDKRTGLFKAIQKEGLCVHFARLGPEELTGWVISGFRRSRKTIDPEAAAYLVSISEPDMYFIRNEIFKIDHYTGERSHITLEDVRAVATVTIKSVIFDLMDAVAGKDKARALSYLDDMLELKEPEQKILAMIAKQTGEILKMKEFQSLGLLSGELARYFPKKHPFVIKKLTEQAARLDAAYLRNFLKNCVVADASYKKGRISPRLSLEVLLNSI